MKKGGGGGGGGVRGGGGGGGGGGAAGGGGGGPRGGAWGGGGGGGGGGVSAQVRRLWEAEAARHVKENGLRPALMAVPRVQVSELTLRRFREEFAIPRRPVVIEGLAASILPSAAASSSSSSSTMLAEHWGLEYWRRACGDRPVSTVRYNKTAKTWGGHTPNSAGAGLNTEERNGTTTTLESFLSRLVGQDADGGGGDQEEYLADFGLLHGCPAATRWRESWRVPRYFARDFFQQAAAASLQDGDGIRPFSGSNGAAEEEEEEAWARAGRAASPRDSWPSLFIGNAGTRTGTVLLTFFLLLLLPLLHTRTIVATH
eukprot:COSAG06_NODE_824_length_12073_cov_102.305161_3_plen_315_part_00